LTPSAFLLLSAHKEGKNLHWPDGDELSSLLVIFACGLVAVALDIEAEVALVNDHLVVGLFVLL
jgi:hypothetical protein